MYAAVPCHIIGTGRTVLGDIQRQLITLAEKSCSPVQTVRNDRPLGCRDRETVLCRHILRLAVFTFPDEIAVVDIVPHIV